MNLTIANRLVELRQALGLSQEALASSLGVSRQAVSKWERGESSPDTDNLIALASLYGVSLDALLLDRGPLFPQAGEPEPSLDSIAANEAAERKRRKRAFMCFPYPVFLALCYLWLGFMFHLWHPGWLIFLTIPIYYGMVVGMD